MALMAEHARIPLIKPVTARAAAWAVLVVIGGTQVTFNIVHAVGGGRLNVFLAVLYGVAPVFTAMCLSHIVATYKGGWFMQAVTFAVMAGAMGLSISASADVVAPGGRAGRTQVAVRPCPRCGCAAGFAGDPVGA